MATLHYASGDVTNQGFDPAAAAAGFNLADVNDAETLNSLPAGVKGLYYLEEAKGVTPSFISEMNSIKNSPNLFAVYLADEPYPAKVSAADLKAESDWIHANMPGVKTFIVADNMGSNQNPNFNNYYTVDSTHIDLWGLDPYPVRSEMSAPDYSEIGRTITAAETQIGVSAANIVPVFQAFGGGNDGDNGQWVMPTADQERAIISEFAKFVPNPAFDYAYSWMQQNGDTPLSQSAELQQVFQEHNSQTASTPSTPTETTTPPSTGTSTAPTGTGSSAPSDPETGGGTGTAPVDSSGTNTSHTHNHASGHHQSDGGQHGWASHLLNPTASSADAFHFGGGSQHTDPMNDPSTQVQHHHGHLDGFFHM